jgi:hypothetical protein
MRRPSTIRMYHARWIAKRAEVVELRRLGHSFRSIAHTKRCSLSFVQDALRRVAETQSHADRPRSGRPRKVTAAVAKQTVALLRNRKVGSVRKARLKLRGSGIDLSVGTIHNIAQRADLRSAVPIPKPKLTPEHRQLRLAWATAHDDDTEETIRRFVFSDEKSFLVTDVSHRLWLRPAEPTPIRETGTHRNARTHISSVIIHSAPRARIGALRCLFSFCPLLAWTLDIAFSVAKNSVFLVL